MAKFCKSLLKKWNLISVGAMKKWQIIVEKFKWR